ncbi:MAG: hypothetical protein HW421_2204 [Ignavibacteria bacterium]|nr:hypothetical protein [Ignavibacteria bacterium]
MDKQESSSKVKTLKEENGEQDKNEVSESLNELPPEIKKVVELGFSMQKISGSMPNPILSKVNEKHIDRILYLSEKEEDNAFHESKLRKRYNLIYVCLFMIIFIFLTIFLAKDNKDIFLELIKIGVAIVGGFGGGYGFKTYLEYKRNN